MSQGKLLCIDRPKYLKSRYGKGFRLSVTPSRHEPEKAQEYLTKKYPSMTLESSFARSFVYVIPSDPKPSTEKIEKQEDAVKEVKISEVIQDMVVLKNKQLVEDWTLNQCSIEEVFLNLIQEDEVDQ